MENFTIYLEKLYSDFDDYLKVKNFQIHGSLYKYTNMCIWEHNNELHFSNIYDYVYECEEISKLHNGNLNNTPIPVILFESNSYPVIHGVICALDIVDYRNRIREIINVINSEKDMTLSLNKVDK